MAYISFQPNDYFNTKLYTGNGSTQSITGVGFAPDMVWTKKRSATDFHAINDKVRGALKIVFPNTNGAEDASSGCLTSFDSDGFSLGSNSGFNANTATFASWNWKANGAGSSNTDGSVTSTVSVSTTSGFSICKFDATGSTMTFGHGLGVKPAVMLIKRTDSNSNGNWIVYHKNVGATKFLTLNATTAETTSSTRFGDTEPTSSVATVGSELLSGGTYIAYCFAEKTGFSSMGSYTGNGNADGSFIYTGFKPAFVLIKDSGRSESWYIFDNRRLGYNGAMADFLANTTAAESSSSATLLDLVSNGFKLRGTTDHLNGSGQNFIFMAFAEAPLVGSNNIPATAR